VEQEVLYQYRNFRNNMPVFNPTTILGTPNEITASSPGAGLVTLSIPNIFIVPGSITISTGLTVTSGGIVDSSLTANSFLYSGTAGLLTTTAAPTDGQLLIGSTGAAPVAATIGTSGSGISVTNGAGTITLANTGVTSLIGTTYLTVSASTGAITLTNAGVTTFNAGTTGFTPSTATGDITLGGILNPENGGTGVANANTSTITLGGSFTTTPANNITLTTTGATNVTLPTSGTLVTTTTAVTSFSAGSTGLTPATATTGDVTLAGTLAVGYGGTGSTSFTAFGVVYEGATSTSPLLSTAAGTTGQVLTATTGSAPTWATLSGVSVTSFQTSLSGLTPSTATTGAITLAGTLNPLSGGTGVSNVNTSTITLGGPLQTGGSFTTTPANNITLTTTGSTSITLPVSGTVLSSTDINNPSGTGGGVQQYSANLSSLASLSGTGIVVQTGTNTFTDRTILGTTGDIVVTNGNGVSGNPTIDLATVGTPVSDAFVYITTDVYGRVTATSAVTQTDLTGIIGTYYLPESGGTMSGNISMGGNYITNLATPTTPDEAANKSYVDSIATGLIWQQPIQGPNLVSDAGGPPASPQLYDEYIIGTGDNTGVWSGFSVGDVVEWNGTSWIKIETGAIGQRYGITFTTSTTASGSFTGHGNQIVTITGGTPGAWTYSYGTPVNSWAVTDNNPSSLEYNSSYVYSTSLGEWVLFSSSVAVIAGAGLYYSSGTTLNVGTASSSRIVSVAGSPGYIDLALVGTAQPTSALYDITVDAWGRVTSTTAATASDIETALGYTPVASFSAGTTGLTPATATTGVVTLAGILNLASGGTNADLTASAGSIVYSTASAMAFSAVGTSGYYLTSGGTGAPTWSNPATTMVTSFQTSLSGLTPSTATTGAITLAGTLNATSGGTGAGTAPTAGQILVGTTGGEYVPYTLASGTGISTTTGSGTLQINNTGVTSWSAGSTGLTPSTATTGAVTLAGTLAVGFGGTGTATAPTADGVIYASSASAYASTAAGTTGQVLVGNTGSAPTWSTMTGIMVTSFQTSLSGLTPSTATTGAVTLAGTLGLSSGGTNATTGAVNVGTGNAGSIIYDTGTALVDSVVGTSGYLLVSGGTSAPSWTNAPTISGANITAASIPNSALVNSSITVSTSGSGIGVSGSPVSLGGTVTLSNTGVTSNAAGPGINVSTPTGAVTISNTGVLSFSAGTTGLTPATATTGVVTLAGVLNPANGGTGVANNNASTITISGSFPLTLTLTNTTSVTLPTSGTLLSTTSGNYVSSFSAGSTGLTPSTATTGAVTLAGTLSVGNGGTGQTTFTTDGILYGNGSNAIQVTAAGTSGQVLIGNTGSAPSWTALSGIGVTSFNTSLSGLTPTSATMGAVTLAGTLNATSGGTGAGTAPTAGQILVGTTGGEYVPYTLASGTGISTTTGSGTLQINNTGVTSWSAGSTGLTPATATTGDVTLAGTLAVGFGGTGATATPTNGQILIGNGTTFTVATLGTSTGISTTTGAGTLTINNTGVTSNVAGTGISVSSATGAVTITNTGVTSITFGSTGLTPATATTGAVTVAGTLVVGNGGTGDTSFTTNGVLYGNNTSALGVTAAGTTGQVLTATTGSAPTWATLSGVSVTSFQTSLSGLTPSTATTGAITLAGTLNATSGGTGTGTAPTAGQILVGTTGGEYVPYTLASGTGISTTTGSGTLQINNTGVTSNIAGTGITVSSATGAVTIGTANIPNSSLTNSNITIGTTSISLGGTSTTLGGMTGITFSSGTVTGVASPVNQTDVVNLAYLQQTLAGLEWKDVAVAATTVDLGSVSYSNGSSGVGATLTNAGTQAVFSIDGVSPAVNSRVLIKNETNQTYNGIYTVTNVGSGSSNWVLTRAIDANTSTALNNATLYVTTGTTQGGTAWTQTTANPSIGVNNIVWVQTASAGGNAVISFQTSLGGLSPSTPTSGVVTLSGVLTAGSGGTGSSSGPTSGQFLYSSGGTTYAPTNLSAQAVTTFSAGSTGLTPSTATSGAITLAGTLVVGNGGTGDTSFTSGAVLYGNGTGALGSTLGSSGQVLTGTGGAPSWQTMTSIMVTSFQTSLSGLTPSTATTGAITLAGTLNATSGGTGTGTAPGVGQFLFSSFGTTYAPATLTSLAVTSFSAGATGLQPVAPTEGAVTLSGTLVVGNGGTGSTSFTAFGVVYEGATSTSPLLSTAAGTTGQVLVGNTGSAPTWSTLSGVSVTTLTGTANEVLVNGTSGTATSGAITLTTPQAIGTTSSVTFGNVTDSALTANSFIYPSTAGLLASTAAATNGQLLIGSTGAAPVAATIGTSGSGISVTNGAGTITLANTGVTSWSAGTTGFTPSTATTGAVTLAGILNPVNGGTGVANNNASTITISGSFPLTLTLSASTSVTLPTSGTLLSTANIAANAVTTISFGTTGLTPATATDGAVTVAGTLVVGNGGTGQTSFTTDGVLYGNNTGGLGVTAAGTTGQVLVGNTGSAPTWSTLSSIGVTTFQTSLSGLTPSTATTGAVTLAGTLGATSGGTGSGTAPTTGQFLYSSGGTTYAPTTLSTVAVTSFSGDSTGLTPATATTGAVTLGGILNLASGGTGQTTAAAAYNALSPMTTTGDIEYESGTNIAARLAIGAQSQVLTVNSGLPAWEGPGNLNVISVATTIPANYSYIVTGPLILNAPLTVDGVLEISGTPAPPTTYLAGAGLSVTTTSNTVTYSSTGTASINTAVSAGTNSQGAGTPLTSVYNFVTGGTNGGGVVLPTITTVGQLCYVQNAGLNSGINVYPASGASIDGQATNAAVTVFYELANGYMATSTTTWRSIWYQYMAGSAPQPFNYSFTGGGYKLTWNAPASSGIPASAAGINTTETYMTASFSPSVYIGATIKILLQGTCTTTVANLSTFNIRIGANGTTGDTVVLAATCTSGTTGTTVPFYAEFYVTFQTTTSALAGGTISTNSVTGISNALTVVAGAGSIVSGLSTAHVGISYLTAATTTTSTFYIASVQQIV
jgi:hypothetical protein